MVGCKFKKTLTNITTHQSRKKGISTVLRLKPSNSHSHWRKISSSLSRSEFRQFHSSFRAPHVPNCHLSLRTHKYQPIHCRKGKTETTVFFFFSVKRTFSLTMMNRITSSTLLLLSLLILATDIHAFVPFSSSRTTSHSNSNTRLGVFGDDSFDMDELRQRISQEGVPPLFAVTTPRRPEFVHAVFFNPHTDREGMHTIEYPQGSGNNVILAFEDANDCAAFSQDLQRQHFYNPTVSYI
jgi:hypothetical protein